MSDRKCFYFHFIEDDYTTNECPYVVHVTNLPVGVTSKEVSKHFNVPVGVILLYPCYQQEKTYVKDGRSSSEAWIKNFSDLKSAQTLAKAKTETFVRTNRIQCEAMLETINDEEELCKRFQQGQCPYTNDSCYFKHYSCSERDTCEDIQCWYGHSMKRKTKSIERPFRRKKSIFCLSLTIYYE